MEINSLNRTQPLRAYNIQSAAKLNRSDLASNYIYFGGYDRFCTGELCKAPAKVATGFFNKNKPGSKLALIA